MIQPFLRAFMCLSTALVMPTVAYNMTVYMYGEAHSTGTIVGIILWNGRYFDIVGMDEGYNTLLCCTYEFATGCFDQGPFSDSPFLKRAIFVLCTAANSSVQHNTEEMLSSSSAGAYMHVAVHHAIHFAAAHLFQSHRKVAGDTNIVHQNSDPFQLRLLLYVALSLASCRTVFGRWSAEKLRADNAVQLDVELRRVLHTSQHTTHSKPLQ